MTNKVHSIYRVAIVNENPAKLKFNVHEAILDIIEI